MRSMASIRRYAVLVATSAVIACGHDDLTSPVMSPLRVPPVPVDPLPAPPKAPPVPSSGYGSVVVTTRTSGAGLDHDGYVVRTDGWWDYSASPMRIGVNGTVTIQFLSAGAHGLSLDDVAPNCGGAGLIDRPITVVANTEIQVVFEVICRY